LIENAVTVGGYLVERLGELAGRHDSIGDIRGRGLMIGVEMVEDRATKARAKALRDQAMKRCFERGLLILGCGANTVRWAPPLIIDRATVDLAVDIFDDVLNEIGA
jgi:4-aminobutyrate aminotransferase